jgi:hypothetical protein
MLLKILLKVGRFLGLNYLFRFLTNYSKLFYFLLVIFTNFIPIYGVFYLNWRAFDIFFLYWLENGVIGFFNIIKMYYAEGEFAETLKRPYMEYTTDQRSLNYKSSSKGGPSPMFFLVHYGGFFMIHGFFLFQVFRDSPLTVFRNNSEAVIVFLASLFIVYTFSLVFDYFGKNQYKVSNKTILMFSPYLRVVSIHLIILLGGFLVGDRQLISVFIVLKIIADLFFYVKVTSQGKLLETVSQSKQVV